MLDKRFTVALLSLLLIIDTVYSDCTDEKGNPIEASDEGVGGFFHNLGCSIQRGAKKIGEGAMKLGEKETWQKFGENIEEGAKKIGDADTWKNLGTQVKDKFSDLKDKISGTDSKEEVHKRTQSVLRNDSEIPFMIDIRSMSLIDNNSFTYSSFNSSGSGKPEERSPTSFDDRFLTETSKRCPDGQALNHRNQCRNVTKASTKINQ